MFDHGLYKILENSHVIPRLLQYKPRNFRCLVLSGPKNATFTLFSQNLNPVHGDPTSKQTESQLIFNSNVEDTSKNLTINPHQSFSVSLDFFNGNGIFFILVYSADATVPIQSQGNSNLIYEL